MRNKMARNMLRAFCGVGLCRGKLCRVKLCRGKVRRVAAGRDRGAVTGAP